MQILKLPRIYVSRSFRRKLLLFVLLAVVITTVVQFLFLINNFRAISDFALQQNTAGMERTVEEFLANYAQEKAVSTSLQIQAAQANLGILGRTAQKLVDNYDTIRRDPSVLNLALFQSDLREVRGALTANPDDAYEIFIQPSLADDPAVLELVQVSGLLNLSMDAVAAADPNTNFIYFVGGEDAPFTRGYPNIGLINVVGDNIDLDFWQDYFPGSVENWSRWYRDPALQAEIPSPITVIGPYADAAGQGAVVTMFYPLWDYQNDRFAGAVGVDIRLDSIIENILSFRVARTGFAFLMNGSGEVVAMPEIGFQLFGIDLTPINQGSLTFYSGALANSNSPAVQELAAAIQTSDRGLLNLDLAREGEEPRRELISYASLPALSNPAYGRDSWKIVIAVPEAEVFEVLNETDAAVNAERNRISLLSLAIVFSSVVLVSLIAVRFSSSATRDLRTLAAAARQVSAKQYDTDFRIESSDEIGQLGHTFQSMTREIRDYTTNLEQKVAERTVDLQRANNEISRLNSQLRDENLRLGAELDVARRLQMMVLPPESETSAVTELDISCFMRPADEVGGDYYDVLQVGDTVYLGIGDVTGHGLPAGIIMLMAQTAFLTLSQSGEDDMERIVSLLNSVLYRNIVRIQEDKNMTLAVLQYRNRAVRIVGQHESVLVCRVDGAVEVIDTMDLGLPMGLEENISEFVAMKQLELASGDVMLLYTDGVTEAENGEHKQFGIGNLILSLANARDGCAEQIKQHIMDDLYAFIGDTRIYDDISLLVVKQR
ncbi:MAG: SpoIIE family protein phosphatase [Oscillochloris sp.]|nr:SpoIIE family protein phosphatase [Oscillochloris sp.]